MIYGLKVHSKVDFLKATLFFVVLCWALTATFLLVRLKPQIVLVGIDQYGTRIISEEGDRLTQLERDNFIKKYLGLLYTFRSTDFDTRVSAAGDMMGDVLWASKKVEFLEISKKLKSQELSQSTEVEQLREIGPETFEADLKIVVRSKLQESVSRIRVEIKLRKVPRTSTKPFPFEVETHEENSLS
jgi:hypothetical protein